MKKFIEKDVAENPLYHDTWKLLKKYRDVVWSLEISVQHVRAKFEIEYGTSIEEFLDSVYLAGADLSGSGIEHHAKCIERSHKMLKLLDSAVELLRTRHKNGEAYYWLLYYSFLSPQQLKNVEEIIENLRPHIRDISFRTYYRKRREAIDALILAWNYLKLLLEAAERYVLLGVLVYTAPVAFSMGASQTTSNIWKSWCRMLGGQIFLLIMNAWCLRLFTSMVGSFIANPLSL